MQQKNTGKIGLILKDIFINDLKIKIICLILAVIIYVFVSISVLSEKIFIKDLEIPKLSSNYIISNNYTDKIKVIIKEKKNVLDRITDSDIKIYIDFDDINTINVGEYKFPIKVSYPKNIFTNLFSSIELTPSVVELNIDYMKEKNVKINVITDGNLESNYILKEIKVSPSYIRIQGPESALDKITSVETEKINLAYEKKSFERVVKLISKNPRVKIIGKQEALVNFVVDYKFDMKNLKIEKVYLKNVLPNFMINVENLPLNLTIKAKSDLLENIISDDIIISIDCSEINKEGFYDYENYTIALPSGAEVVNITPKILALYVTKKR